MADREGQTLGAGQEGFFRVARKGGETLKSRLQTHRGRRGRGGRGGGGAAPEKGGTKGDTSCRESS